MVPTQLVRRLKIMAKRKPNTIRAPPSILKQAPVRLVSTQATARSSYSKEDSFSYQLRRIHRHLVSRGSEANSLNTVSSKT
jgi:hypothetical protein